jgi:hypothetical protein
MSFGKPAKILIAGAILSLGVVLYLIYGKGPVAPDDGGPDTVATVAGRSITVEEFSAQMVRRSGGFANQFTTLEQKQALLNEIVQRELQIAHARAAGYDRDPEVIAVLERAMIGKLREDQLASKMSALTVSDTEIERYFLDHQEAYTTPAMNRIAIIRFELPAGASDEKRTEIQAKAEEVLVQAHGLDKTVKGFGALAVRHSEDQASRYVGGDVGWISAGRPSRVDDAAFNKAVAELSDSAPLSPVVQASDSLYLIKLLDIRLEKTRDIEQVSSDIHRLIMRQKRADTEVAWLASLKDERNPVKINQTVLESVPPPVGTRELRKQDQPPALPHS